MTTQIDWGDGSGDKITLTYTAASGNQVISVSSAANAGASSRTKNINFSVTAGGTTITRTLTVVQLAGSSGLIIPTYNDVYPTYNDVARGFQDSST